MDEKKQDLLDFLKMVSGKTKAKEISHDFDGGHREYYKTFYAYMSNKNSLPFEFIQSITEKYHLDDKQVETLVDIVCEQYSLYFSKQQVGRLSLPKKKALVADYLFLSTPSVSDEQVMEIKEKNLSERKLANAIEEIYNKVCFDWRTGIDKDNEKYNGKTAKESLKDFIFSLLTDDRIIKSAEWGNDTFCRIIDARYDSLVESTFKFEIFKSNEIKTRIIIPNCRKYFGVSAATPTID